MVNEVTVLRARLTVQDPLAATSNPKPFRILSMRVECPHAKWKSSPPILGSTQGI